MHIAPGETIYFCGTVGHTYNEHGNDLIWRWDFKDGNVEEYSTDEDDYHEHNSNTYLLTIEPGTYEVSLKVWVDGSPGNGDEGTCTLEVVVVELYRDAGYLEVLDDYRTPEGVPTSPK